MLESELRLMLLWGGGTVEEMPGASSGGQGESWAESQGASFPRSRREEEVTMMCGHS